MRSPSVRRPRVPELGGQAASCGLAASVRVARADGLLVRHEALLLRMEVKDRPSPRCRSSGVKREAA